MKSRLHLLNIHCDPKKSSSPLYGRLWLQNYKTSHKFSKFVKTLVSRRICSNDLKPKDVKNFDFLSSLYIEPLQEYATPKFEIGDRS